MGQFNGGTPDILGLEPRWQGQYTVNLTDGLAILERVKPNAATIRKIHLYNQFVGGSNPGLALEFLTGDPLAPFSVTNWWPGADVTTTGWEKWDSALSNQYQAVDDQFDITDGIRNLTAVGRYERRDATFRGTATPLAGVRPLALVMTLNALFFQWVAGTKGAVVRMFLDIAGQRYYGPDVLWANDFAWHQPPYIAGWLRNPATQKPWTLAALNNIFATGSTDKFGFQLSADQHGPRRVDSRTFSVAGITAGILSAAEARGGTAGNGSKYVISKPRNGWDAYQLDGDVTTFADTYYWILASAYGGNLAASGSSLVVPRFTDDHGTIAVAANAASTKGAHRQTVTAALSQGIPQTTNPPRSAPLLDGVVSSIPFLLETSAGVINEASQPYARLNRLDMRSTSPANQGQKLTPTATVNYGAALLTVGWGSYTAPNAPLVVEVRTAINGGTLLATGILQPDPNDTWVRDRYIIFDTPAAVTSGTAVFLHIKSATTAGPWRILQYDTRSDNILAGAGTTVAQVEGAGLGGQTDGFFSNGGLLTRYDLAACLIQNPPNPDVTITTRAAL